MRRSAARALTPAILAALLLLAGCGKATGGQAAAQPASAAPEVDMRYGISWPDRSAYHDEETDRAVATCAALPGARQDPTASSLPPLMFVAFAGTPAQQRVVAACLATVGGAVKTLPPFHPDPNASPEQATTTAATFPP